MRVILIEARKRSEKWARRFCLRSVTFRLKGKFAAQSAIDALDEDGRERDLKYRGLAPKMGRFSLLKRKIPKKRGD
jgi:hypothetical protein